MAIDIGAAASDRSNNATNDHTYVLLDNPANASGYLDSFETWFNTDGTGVKFGTFRVNGGDATKYTNIDSESIGNVTSGSKQTFTGKNCDVASGDYIGWYSTTGKMERATSGGAGIYDAGYTVDTFGAGEATYTLVANNIHSLYATGIETATGVPKFAHYYRRLAGN